MKYRLLKSLDRKSAKVSYRTIGFVLIASALFIGGFAFAAGSQFLQATESGNATAISTNSLNSFTYSATGFYYLDIGGSDPITSLPAASLSPSSPTPLTGSSTSYWLTGLDRGSVTSVPGGTMTMWVAYNLTSGDAGATLIVGFNIIGTVGSSTTPVQAETAVFLQLPATVTGTQTVVFYIIPQLVLAGDLSQTVTVTSITTQASTYSVHNVGLY